MIVSIIADDTRRADGKQRKFANNLSITAVVHRPLSATSRNQEVELVAKEKTEQINDCKN